MSSEPSCLLEEITEDTLLPVLNTVALGRRIHAFGQCESTSLLARRLLEGRRNPPASRSAGILPARPAGVSLAARHHGQTNMMPCLTRTPEHGTLIVADFQTGGRGRTGRPWVSPRGSSLLFSLILDPEKCAGPAPVSEAGSPYLPTEPDAERDAGAPNDAVRSSSRVTMAAAAAVAGVASRRGAAGCTIKWPNDVLAPDGRKLCGILTERVARPNAPDALIVGIGLNVNQAETDFPEELRPAATSVRVLRGGPVSRLRLLKEILEDFEGCLAMPEDALFDAWEKKCSTLGRHVRARAAGREIFGRAVGLDQDGGLILQLETGELETIYSGDVEELRMTGEE